MSRKEDPVMLFEQLSKIENQFSTAVNKADAIAIVMDAAPDEYQAILNTEQRAKGDEITLFWLKPWTNNGEACMDNAKQN